MRISSFIALLGFILLTAGTFSPLLRPLGLFSWDAYGLNKPYGIVMLVVALTGALATILQMRTLAKVAAIASLLLVVLLYVAAVFQVNTTFTFIPFKRLSAGLTHLIKYKWGWYMLFAGGIIAVTGSLANKPPVVITAKTPTAPI